MVKRCPACQEIVSPTNAVNIPDVAYRRIEWADIFEIDHDVMLGYNQHTIFCSCHFNQADLVFADGKVKSLNKKATPLPFRRESTGSPAIKVRRLMNYKQTYSRPNESIEAEGITSTLSPAYEGGDFDYHFTGSPQPIPARKKRGPYRKIKDIYINVDDEMTPRNPPIIVELPEEKEEPAEDLVEYVLISKKMLLSIFNHCPECNTGLSGQRKKELRTIGTAASITYRCPKCCPQSQKTWATQETIPGTKIYQGNALLASAASITPVPFPTLKELFTLAKIGIFGETLHRANSKNVVWPVVREHHTNEHVDLLKMVKDRTETPLNVLMDGQYDSPGYCASLCCVTAMDSESGYILAFETLHKSMTADVSGRMEAEGVRKILDLFEENEIQVNRLTTDRHTTIIKMVREQYPSITHMYDAWHMVKPIVRDLRNEAKKKKSSNLKDFIKGIKNHLWYSISESKGDGELCREILLSSLFHIIGIHEFENENIFNQLYEAIEDTIGKDKKMEEAFQKMNPGKGSDLFKSLNFTKIDKCKHTPINPDEDDNEYMNPISYGYFCLFTKITNEKFLADIIKTSPDFATSRVENFHSLATGKYCPKKTYFPYHGYDIRRKVAVLHYNNNVRCEKNGTRKTIGSKQVRSKANAGEMVTKIIKSKAPITWKHDIIRDCLEKIEKRNIIDEEIPSFDNEDEILEDEEELFVNVHDEEYYWDLQRDGDQNDNDDFLEEDEGEE